MTVPEPIQRRIRGRLELLYGDRAPECLDRVVRLLAPYAAKLPQTRKPAWNQRDTVLITYGDQVRAAGVSPLRSLGMFLDRAGLKDVLGTIHILPFFPYSSDDGFSVIDYRQVDPALGDWSDLAALGNNYELMFDLVLNHVSRRSRWFTDYVAGRHPYTDYFIEVDPSVDLSSVVRPRNLPLLTPVETSRGLRHVWTTFSDDQIDLKYAEPDVLLEMLSVLLFYIEQGARIIRLDAIAYLWKTFGTSSIHLPQTHEVVKLMRDVVDAVAPGTILLTETNVPQEENASYFGDGDEAHMVYQFSLGPLLLESLLTGDATLLAGWLKGLPSTPPGATVFNFTASHDGIGVRPLEGIMPADRKVRFIEMIRARGGHVSTKRNPDGSESPYELNITWFSALSDTDPQRHIRRFLTSQAVMLALRGIPGVYFHSLVATPNDTAGVERSGRARSINRKKCQLDELESDLRARDSVPGRVLAEFRRILAVRVQQPAFHPEARQDVVDLGHSSLIGFLRTSLDERQRILVLANLGPQPCEIDCAAVAGLSPKTDLLAESETWSPGNTIRLEAYQTAWVT
ncbi:MAG: DUF3459 domain-containing protein [Rhodopirellula sp.]|nr:DUF3459 domain-containing protein [Rhodopirellula sp.]